MSLKIIFAGTPDFAVPALQALFDSEHEVIAVYTQPDRPAGRGRKLTASPVKQLALAHEVPVYQPLSLKDADAQQVLADLHADVMIVVAYGLILPEVILQAPKFGCINIHGSLLPKWRGAAPIQRAVEAGDEKTGVTIMQMDKGLDTGDMLRVAECAITENDTSQSLHDKLAVLGSQQLMMVLNDLENNVLKPQQQNNEQATYAHKITKAQASINWELSASVIINKIHAFNPWPVAQTCLQDAVIRIWNADLWVGDNDRIKDVVDAKPGQIIKADKFGIMVACGKDFINITELQLSGGKRLSAADIVNSGKIDLSQKVLLG